MWFENFNTKWKIINQDLAKKIKGYNSRMDNWRQVEGAYSRNVFRHYSEAVTYAMVSEDKILKESYLINYFNGLKMMLLKLQNLL